MLYIGGGNVVEAVGDGVRSVGINVALNGATLAIALRRRNLTEKQRSAVLDYAAKFALKKLPYDALGAAGAGVATGSKGAALTGFGCAIYLPFCAVAGGAATGAVMNNASAENADTAFFCSELVARCFELAGAPIVEGSASFAAPRAIRMATTLLRVGKLVDTPPPDPGIPFGSPL
jgi:hypothetical protein